MIKIKMCSHCADVATYKPSDVRPVLASYRGQDVGKEFARRVAELTHVFQTCHGECS